MQKLGKDGNHILAAASTYDTLAANSYRGPGDKGVALVEYTGSVYLATKEGNALDYYVLCADESKIARIHPYAYLAECIEDRFIGGNLDKAELIIELVRWSILTPYDIEVTVDYQGNCCLIIDRLCKDWSRLPVTEDVKIFASYAEAKKEAEIIKEDSLDWVWIVKCYEDIDPHLIDLP